MPPAGAMHALALRCFRAAGASIYMQPLSLLDKPLFWARAGHPFGSEQARATNHLGHNPWAQVTLIHIPLRVTEIESYGKSALLCVLYIFNYR